MCQYQADGGLDALALSLDHGCMGVVSFYKVAVGFFEEIFGPLVLAYTEMIARKN